jgi:hypothetical protein
MVSVDHLGVGESSQHGPDALTFSPVAAAAHAAEADVRGKLAAGTLLDGLGPVERPVTIGIGQSMGGALTVLQQGRYHDYDGIGVLGYSALHTLPPTGPDVPDLVVPWVPRDVLPSSGVFTNAPTLDEVATDMGLPPRRRRPGRRGSGHGRLPGTAWRPATVGLGDDPRRCRLVVRVAGIPVDGVGGDPVPGAGGPG